MIYIHLSYTQHKRDIYIIYIHNLYFSAKSNEVKYKRKQKQDRERQKERKRKKEIKSEVKIKINIRRLVILQKQIFTYPYSRFK